jgi:hypothetical protein
MGPTSVEMDLLPKKLKSFSNVHGQGQNHIWPNLIRDSLADFLLPNCIIFTQLDQ